MEYTHRQKGADKMYKTWHAQSGYMFIYTYSEGGSIVSREHTYPIRRGALAVVAPGKYHYTMPKDQELYERSKLFLTRDEAKLYFAPLGFFELSEKALIYASLPVSFTSNTPFSSRVIWHAAVSQPLKSPVKNIASAAGAHSR